MKKGIDFMNVIALDLSQKCIGITFARLTEKQITSLSTTCLAPKKLKPSDVGFISKKSTFFTRKGGKYHSYVLHKDEVVPLYMAKKRSVYFRNENRKIILRQISVGLDDIFKRTCPDILIMEQNSSFKGILTTKQLAEVAGEVHAFAGQRDIPLKEYYVQTIRAKYNVLKLLKTFCESKTKEELLLIPDKTKAAIKEYFLERFKDFNLSPTMTLDEGDSLAAFAYWYDTEIL
jgi:hypothetical protein